MREHKYINIDRLLVRIKLVQSCAPSDFVGLTQRESCVFRGNIHARYFVD